MASPSKSKRKVLLKELRKTKAIIDKALKALKKATKVGKKK